MTNDTTELPRTRAEIIAQMERARQELETTWAGLSDAQISAASTSSDWSVKDHLAHLAAWAAGIGALLRRQPRWAAMGVDAALFYTGDDDAINAAIYQRHRDDSLPTVRAAFDQAHRGVISALDELGDAGLAQTYSHYQPDDPRTDSGAPVSAWVAGNTYEHYAEHQPWIAAWVARRGW